MTQPDDLNISDAALCALRNAGWIPPLVRKGTSAIALPRRKRSHHAAPKPVPAGLVVPQGVTWDPAKGCFVSRLTKGRATAWIGRCAATQEALDALGEKWAAAAALREAGESIEEIREAIGC